MNIVNLSMKAASIPGKAPGPAKPINPNAIKPIMLGLPQAQTGAGGQDMEQMQQQQDDMAAQQKATEEAGKARLSAQQAQQEAAIAKQQLALAKQQQAQVSSSVANSSSNDSAVMKSTMRNMGGRLKALRRSSNSLFKAAADGRVIRNPYVQPYNAGGEYGDVAASKGVKPDGSGSSPWSFTKDFFSGAGKGIKNPEDMEMSQIEGPWKPLANNYQSGSIGAFLAPATNLYTDAHRHVLNAIPEIGRDMVGASSLPAQALAKTWDAGRDIAGMISRDGLNARPQDSKYLKEIGEMAQRSAMPVLRSMGNLSPVGLATNAGLRTADSMAQAELGVPLTTAAADAVGSVYKHLTGGEAAATPQQAAAPSAPEDVTQWLGGLMQQLQSYWQNSQASKVLKDKLLPSQVGAAGHQVRNPYAFF